MPSLTNGSLPTRLQPKSDLRDACKEYPICLVTGGSGYIGSHTVLELINAGMAVVVLDSLVNSHMESLCRVYSIARHEYDRLSISQERRPLPPLFFHNIDLRDEKKLKNVFAYWQKPDTNNLEHGELPIHIGDKVIGKQYQLLSYSINLEKRPKPLPSTTIPEKFGKIHSIIHFAALKAVGESVVKPLEYYDNNITGLLVLLRTMKLFNVKEIVFSSSAVVYGRGNEMGITEEAVQVGGQGGGAGLLTNPYGRSKWMAEEILNDCCISDHSFHTVALRYFNPTGSHPSGLIGEDPKGTPNNIVPVILSAYQRRRSKVMIYGSNYDTADGTGVRDYIHVSDLAKGHLAALRKLTDDAGKAPAPPTPADVEQKPNYSVYNLGTGRGYSVLDILNAFSTIAGVDIPFAIGEARAGDLGTVTASTTKAETELEWEAEFGLQDMCRDVYNWAAENPSGYEVLRRLSTISTGTNAPLNPQAMRKASVAAGLFKTEGEFDKFVNRTRRDSGFVDRGGMGALGHRMSSLKISPNFSLGSAPGAIPEEEEEEDEEEEHEIDSSPANQASRTHPLAFGAPFAPSQKHHHPHVQHHRWNSGAGFSRNTSNTISEEDEDHDQHSPRTMRKVSTASSTMHSPTAGRKVSVASVDLKEGGPESPMTRFGNAVFGQGQGQGKCMWGGQGFGRDFDGTVGGMSGMGEMEETVGSDDGLTQSRVSPSGGGTGNGYGVGFG